MPNNREIKQYQALTVIGVVPDIPKREVIIALKGDEKEETYDLGVALPAGAVGGMFVALHDALAKIDAQTQDKAAVMQPLKITGAGAANPIVGHCAVVLRVGGFAVPAMMTKEAALQTIAALKQAIELTDLPPSVPKQLS